MDKKLLLLATALILVAVTCSPALAVAPFGTPTADLKQGQSSVAFEYAHGEADLEFSGLGLSGTVEDVKSNAFLANLGYGATDDWEVYVLLGAANAEWDVIDGDYGFAYGFGTKYTFAKDESLSWGAMFQMGWTNSEDKVTVDLSDYGYGVDTWDIEFDFYEIVIAVGPTYKMSETLRIYGGPFFYFLDGDLNVDISGTSGTIDLEEKSQFGGYVGAQLDLEPSPSEVTDSYYLFGEFQFTGDSWAFGTGIGWKF